MAQMRALETPDPFNDDFYYHNAMRRKQEKSRRDALLGTEPNARVREERGWFLSGGGGVLKRMRGAERELREGFGGAESFRVWGGRGGCSFVVCLEAIDHASRSTRGIVYIPNRDTLIIWGNDGGEGRCFGR